jgi:hypothetical protein
VSLDSDAPTAATIFVIKKGHNSGKNGRIKKSLRSSTHPALSSVQVWKKSADSLGGVDATRFEEDVRTDRRVQLYMPPTSWGQKNKTDLTNSISVHKCMRFRQRSLLGARFCLLFSKKWSSLSYGSKLPSASKLLFPLLLRLSVLFAHLSS